MSATPSQQLYEEIEGAYDWFNEKLFDGQLPGCIFTLQRKANTFGFFRRRVSCAGTARERAMRLHSIALTSRIVGSTRRFPRLRMNKCISGKTTSALDHEAAITIENGQTK